MDIGQLSILIILKRWYHKVVKETVGGALSLCGSVIWARQVRQKAQSRIILAIRLIFNGSHKQE